MNTDALKKNRGFDYTRNVSEIQSLRTQRAAAREQHNVAMRERCANYGKPVTLDPLAGVPFVVHHSDHAGHHDDAIYHASIAAPHDNDLPSVEAMAQIELDLDRTFFTHTMFACKDGPGQQSLFNVLAAYARFNPEIGYATDSVNDS